MGVLLRKITGFSGLVHENMYRSTGWRFLSVGRALERALATTGDLARFADTAAPDGALDLVVEIGDSVMTHRRRYVVATTRETVVDLLALDQANPRSVLHQLGAIREHLDALPGASVNGQLSPLARAVLRCHTALAIETPETFGTEGLADLAGEIMALSEMISATYLR
jgi:uncharacterized alpha-E superfamily protein